MSALYPIYRGVTAIGRPALSMFLSHRQSKGKEDPLRLRERKGFASKMRPKGKLVWMHGASVGESLSMLPLITAITTAAQEEITILVTTGTVTSARLMEKRLPDNCIHQFIPLDCPKWVDRFMAHWYPDVVLWFESDIWPNLIHAIGRDDIPGAFINARMSEKSYRRWKKSGSMITELLSHFDAAFTQTPQETQWFKELGIPETDYLGNLKYASKPLPVDDANLEKMREQVGDRYTFVFASTHDDEEAQAARMYSDIRDQIDDFLMIIVPRHPKRADDIRAAIATVSDTLTVSQRSRHEPVTDQTDLYIADTMGEMGLFYRLADVTAIGGSFVQFGGHNPIEPAQLKRPVYYGPGMFNFQAVCAEMEAANAADQVHDMDEMGQELITLASDHQLRQKKAELAHEFALDKRDVVKRILSRLTDTFAKADIHLRDIQDIEIYDDPA